MKKILLTQFLLFSIFVSQGQQIPQLSLGVLNPYYDNPAYGGTTSFMEAAVGSRYQWESSDYNGRTPISAYASVYIPYNRKKGYDQPHAKKGMKHWNTIGVNMGYDQLGYIKAANVQLNFAHNLSLSKKWRLSSALSLGGAHYTIDGTQYVWQMNKMRCLMGFIIKVNLI